MGNVKLKIITIFLAFIICQISYGESLKFDGEILTRTENRILCQFNEHLESLRKVRAEVYTPAKIVYLPGTKESIIHEWALSGEVEISPGPSDKLEGVIIKENIPDMIKRGGKLILIPNRPPVISILNAPNTQIAPQSRHLVNLRVTDPENDGFLIRWNASRGRWLIPKSRRPYNYFLAPDTAGELDFDIEAIDVFGKKTKILEKIHVSDTEPKPLYKFNYTFLEHHPTSSPFSDAIYDKSGNFYILLKNEIRIFSPNGRLIGRIKAPFSYGSKIKIDSSGYLYVLDSSKNSIYKLNIDGKLIAEIKDLSESGDLLKIENPVDFCLDSSNRLFLLDKSLCRILIFNKNADLIAAIGAKGGKHGQMMMPMAIEIDNDSNIYVLDEGSLSIKIFNSRFEMIKSVGLSESYRYIDLVFDSFTESIYVLAKLQTKSKSGSVHLIKFDKNGRSKSFLLKVNKDVEPVSLNIDLEGNLILVQKKPEPILKISPEGNVTGQFQKEDPDRNTDFINGSLGTIYFESGKSIKRLNYFGWIDYIYPLKNTVSSIAVDFEDNLYIAEKGSKKIKVFDDKGRHIQDFAIPLSSKEKLYGLTVDSKKQIFILKSPLNLIVMSSQGVKINEVNLEAHAAKHIQPNGKFFPASAFHVDKFGNLILSDKYKKIVLVVNSDFSDSFILKKQFEKVGGIATDTYGNIYILDISGKSIFIFNKKGRLKREINIKNQVKKPSKIIVFGDGELFVFDEIKKCLFQFQ